MSSNSLDVYLNTVQAGKLVRNNQGNLSFTYSPEFLHRATSGISLCLPLRSEPFTGIEVKAFFSGLLPDDIIRQKIARYLGLSEKNPFALLQAIGGECAGALSLYPEGQLPPSPSNKNIETLDDVKLRDVLELLKQHPLLAGENKMRLSLAGAQNKLPVGFENNRITLITNGAPTTHILKPAIAHIKDSVYNELFCMRLAGKIGIAVPKAMIYFVGDIPCYIVERYDREQNQDGSIKRIHQEDFCQALGILPEIKYEREGGPGINKCIDIINVHSIKPALDQLNFLNIVIFNYLIGNADAHGKNFSLLYRGHKPELAPAYDLLSTTVYPNLSPKMAMKIGSKYDPNNVFLRHWQRIVPNTELAKKNIEKQLHILAEQTLNHAIGLKETFKHDGLTSPVIDAICILIEARAKRITLSW